MANKNSGKPFERFEILILKLRINKKKKQKPIRLRINHTRVQFYQFSDIYINIIEKIGQNV